MTKLHPVSPYVYPGLKLLPTYKLGITQLAKSSKYNVSDEMILNIISEVCKVRQEGILSRSREKELVFARHMFCSILKRYFGYTLKKIGGIVDRDHTTVISSMGAFRNRYIRDLSYREVVHEVYRKVGIRTF